MGTWQERSGAKTEPCNIIKKKKTFDSHSSNEELRQDENGYICDNRHFRLIKGKTDPT